MSPRELGVRFTDQQRYFVAEAQVYRRLKAHNLIASPACVVVKAAHDFPTKTTAPTLTLADRLHLPPGDRLRLVLLSTVLDDFSRYIIAWKVYANMVASDLTDTLEWRTQPKAAPRPVCNIARAAVRQRGLYIVGALSRWLGKQAMDHVRVVLCCPQAQGKIKRSLKAFDDGRYRGACP